MTSPTYKRLVASVTWGQCPNVPHRPHLGELTIYEGLEEDCDGIMTQDHPTLWKVRTFPCRFCHSHVRLVPTALIIEDVAS